MKYVHGVTRPATGAGFDKQCMPASERLTNLAGGQDNLVIRDQLLAIGLGRGAIAHRLSTGRWQRVHPGVFLVAPGTAGSTRSRARRAARVRGGRSCQPHDRGRDLGHPPGRRSGPCDRTRRNVGPAPRRVRPPPHGRPAPRGHSHPRPPAADLAGADDLRPCGNRHHPRGRGRTRRGARAAARHRPPASRRDRANPDAEGLGGDPGRCCAPSSRPATRARAQSARWCG